MIRLVWERRVPGSDVAVQRIEVRVASDGDAVVRVPESVICEVLLAAGWERAS